MAEIAAYYGEASSDLELRFLKCAEVSCRRLAAMPALGAKLEWLRVRFGDIRVWPVHGFPNILIYYRSQEPGIEIVRVLHSARHLDTLFPREYRLE